jgi:hypothetical protein
VAQRALRESSKDSNGERENDVAIVGGDFKANCNNKVDR